MSRKPRKTFAKRLPVNPVKEAPPQMGETLETPDAPQVAALPQAPLPNTMDQNDVNLEDSGFLEPVIKREYAENATPTLGGETPEPAPVKETAESELAPSRPFFGPPKLSKPAAPVALAPGDAPAPVDTPGASIPTMQFQEPIISTDANADSLGRQLGEKVGMTTSEWAFGILENFYPEVVYFFSKIDTTFAEKAGLPADLEITLVQKIMAQNAKIKGRVQISEFHKKNILPPLKRILAQKGWENVIPDEVMLIAGMVMLAGDSFFKINAIRKENRLLTKEVKADIDKYLGKVSEHQKEVVDLKSQLAQMQQMFQTMQEHQQRGVIK